MRSPHPLTHHSLIHTHSRTPSDTIFSARKVHNSVSPLLLRNTHTPCIGAHAIYVRTNTHRTRTRTHTPSAAQAGQARKTIHITPWFVGRAMCIFLFLFSGYVCACLAVCVYECQCATAHIHLYAGARIGSSLYCAAVTQCIFTDRQHSEPLIIIGSS